MEMAEHRDNEIWEVDAETTSPLRRPRRHRTGGIGAAFSWITSIPAPRPRLLGWSLVFAGGSNVGLIIVAVVVGLSPVALVACVALALSSWFLVVAELVSLRRLYESSSG